MNLIINLNRAFGVKTMVFYRYEREQYCQYGSLGLTEFNLVRETPKGYWICLGNPEQLHSKPKWVSKTSKKRYAYPTKEQALENALRRTESRIRHLNGLIERAEMHLRQIDKIKLELKERVSF